MKLKQISEGNLIIIENKDLINPKNIQVYCDMDGVLVDFIGGAVNLLNANLDETVTAEDVIAMQEINWDDKDLSDLQQNLRRLIKNNYAFWVDLQPRPDAYRLWEYIKKYRPFILTGPMGSKSIKAKKDWVEKHLDGYSGFHATHDKYKYANHRDKVGLLIDDLHKYMDKFIDHGGMGILHKSADNTILALKQMGL